MEDIKPKSTTPIGRIRELLDQGDLDNALKYIERLGQKSPEIENARCVCLMRLGKKEEALSVIRDVAFQGHICIPSDAPVLHKINYATAMLLCNRKDGALDLVKNIDEKRYPQVSKLKDAVSRWIKSMNIFEKCCYYISLYPQKAITIDFPPGEI